MKEELIPENNIYMIETALFIASAAREVIKWQHYGSLRLIQTLTKFLDMPSKLESLEKDAFLENIKKEIHENSDLRSNEEKYEKFLDTIIVKMLDEYKKRLNLKT
jgi:hypothetical protein